MLLEEDVSNFLKFGSTFISKIMVRGSSILFHTSTLSMKVDPPPRKKKEKKKEKESETSSSRSILD